MTKLRVLDLFSGIGGFSLGLERTGGFETVAFCEIEEFPRRVLKKHWPEVPCYHDVRELTADTLRRDGIAVDVICGGFPCQDISLAGDGAGLEGERSGLWFEYSRLISEIRPRFIIVENVAALLSRGHGRVLGDLAALGYDAEWHCIPASAVGAPHRRDRIWIVAYPDSEGERQSAVSGQAIGVRPSDRGQALADANRPRLEIKFYGEAGELPAALRAYSWSSEPGVGRMAYGVPARVDRIGSLGNAVVPQIPEMIGHAILKAERAAV
ncbi:DNA (cytosine-5-)-methyltransferase [Sinorhizobium meliloti]|nr:DNA (cytosine-5-)-methyltransferase [Sinorhizobium meliloti]